MSIFAYHRPILGGFLVPVIWILYIASLLFYFGNK